MWMVIHMASSLKEADEIERILSAEGFLCKKKAVYKNRARGNTFYEMLVLKAEAQDARQIISEKFV
ncbi:MAG: hypothetical protein ACOYJD_07590 [Christensenellales bacterium]|jgi:hypothetical protein